MEWIACVKEAINYMESHLLEIKSPEEVAEHVNMSCMYLQKGFQVLTGFTIGEYIRNRRLYLAAVDICDEKENIIDIALKYGYENPSSFDKAFSRFHGVTPMDVRKSRGNIRSFHQLSVSLTLTGGESMQYRIEKKEAFAVAGFQREFNAEDSYKKIPMFWDEMTEKHCSRAFKGEPLVTDIEKYVQKHHVGEFGVCIDDKGCDRFDYMIAGYDDGGDIPNEMSRRVIEAGDWAIFDCTLKTMQDTNTAIWKQWLPGNNEYDLAGKYCIEWYSSENVMSPEMKCQIWIPVKRK